MFVELVDHLRCPEPHETTWLVLAAGETRDRHVISGTLGCPVCGAQYAVAGGTAWFGDAQPSAPSTGRDTEPPTSSDATSEWPLRLAAFLGLADGRGVVGLYGTWAAHAESLGDVVEGIEPLAIDPKGATHPLLSAIVPRSRDVIPLASGALRAVAVDDVNSTGEALAEAARLVRQGGRILAPAPVPLPFGVHELARDAEWWIAERDAGTEGVVSISSKRR